MLPFIDEELWAEGNTNQAPPEGGYIYRMNWDVDKLYRSQRPTWHAVAWALRRPWLADPHLGPTYNAYINGAGYWQRFGAQDLNADRYEREFGPAPVHYQNPEGRLDITASLTDKVFGETLAARLRRLEECGFIIRKWETYDHRFFQGVYEWATGTGCRAIIIGMPKLVITMAPGKSEISDLPPPINIKALAANLKRKDDNRPTAVMPTREELQALIKRYHPQQPKWMPDWQWKRWLDLNRLSGSDPNEPFYYQFVPEYIRNRCRPARNNTPDFMLVYEAWVDGMLGKPYRGWYGFEAASALLPWFVFREAMPAPCHDWFLNYWTSWLMPDRETSKDLFPPLGQQDGKLIHPMYDQLTKTNTPGDSYYLKTGDWRGNKSYYRSGFNYTMSTTNFNNTASMGALLGGALINAERPLADGRHGQANFALKLWTWHDGSTQEEMDDYYFSLTIRAQKMVADFGPEPFDRLLGRSMLLKSMTMLAKDYHPSLRRYVFGASRTAPHYRLVTQDGLYSILHLFCPSGGAFTDIGVAERPEGYDKFGHETPPAEVARMALQGPFAPPWFRYIVEEKPLPFGVKATFKQWGRYNSDPILRQVWLGRNYGVFSSNVDYGIIPIIGQWRRKAEPVANSRDLGTMFVRVGINQTRWVNDAPGWMAPVGHQATLQACGKLLVAGSPLGYGEWLNEKHKITSIQHSIAFFNYESPKPSWEIFINRKPVTTLPAFAKAGDVIAIKDGVTFIGIIPAPAVNLGRKNEVVLRPGDKQIYLDKMSATPALVIDNIMLQRDQPLDKNADWKAIDFAAAGFYIEYGEAPDYKNFEAFQAHLAKVKLTGSHKLENSPMQNYDCQSDNDRLELGIFTNYLPESPLAKLFHRRHINGELAALPSGVERDSHFSIHSRTGILQKGGATLRVTPGKLAALAYEPKTGSFIAAHVLAEPAHFAFTTADGMDIIADGYIGIFFLSWNAEEKCLSVDYGYRMLTDDKAKALIIRGIADKAAILVNDQPLAKRQRITIDGKSALVVPLQKQENDISEDRLSACIKAIRAKLPSQSGHTR